ncbi:MAG: hypothetical protein ABI165_00290, partial [Bryobacteraceae bacterium]
MRIIRLLAILTLAAAAAWPQSYPSAWNYANPDATVLIGFDWTRLQQSPFGAMAKQRIGANQSGLGMPGLTALTRLNQVLLTLDIATDVTSRSKPPFLLILNGDFDLPALRKVASSKGLTPATYHSVLVMTEPPKRGEKSSSMALVGQQIVLFGDHKSVLQAIDRNAPGEVRVFSPAFARAAKLAETHDVWIVAHNLLNQLAGHAGGPLQIGHDVTGLEAGLSFHDGVDAEAELTASTGDAAVKLVKMLEALKPQLPGSFQDFGVAANNNVVQLALTIN